MNRYFLPLLLCSVLTAISSIALASNTADSDGNITKQHALVCIQLNKDLNLASGQMLETESNRTYIKSKITYLDSQLQQRRDLIHELDQRNTQSNNDNYNQLVNQFEELLEERKDEISNYDKEHQLYLSQHESVVRLERRFASECQENIQMAETLHQEVCRLEDVRWCSLFNFSR